MTKAPIREVVHRGLPFTIFTSDGREHPVPHTDFISIGSDNDDTILIHKQEGGFEFIDVFNITSLEVIKKSA